MDPKLLIDGLLMYVGLVVLLTFHEFGHAWVALKCGDDTARLQGRVSLNPLAHIDPIGTVLLPLLMIFMPGAGRFLVGWAKPVPVNPYNLRNPRGDDILVTLAGPGMNFLLAVVLLGLARIGLILHSDNMAGLCEYMAQLSLLLCFFNLIPIPPLDGSQVVRSLIGMSYEAYHQIAQFGFILLIIVINIPWIQHTLAFVTMRTWVIIASWYGLV
jgi:Zn-dependent protease